MRSSMIHVALTVFMFSILLATTAMAGQLDDRVSVLEAQVAALLSDVAILQQENSDQQTTINQQQAAIATLQSDLLAVQGSNVFDFAPYVSVDQGELNGVVGPHVIFEGVNFHVRNGTGRTRYDNGNGLGNLIIGYNEVPNGGSYGTLQPGERSGYHNLILGVENRFLPKAVSGIVQGEGHTIGNINAAAIGGDGNTVSGDCSVAIGGRSNIVSGVEDVAVAGWDNTTAGMYSAIVGGKNNITTNSGECSTVTGGESNTAGGKYSSISGGIARQSLGDHDWVAGSLWENF